MKDRSPFTGNSVLVTGGCGFIGSELVYQLLDEGARVTCVDACTYAVSQQTVRDVEARSDAPVERVDIRDLEALRRVVDDVRPTYIFHLAAESHVDESLERPAEFVETNVVGTTNLLLAAQSAWQRGELPDDFRFVHISTDEVFGSLALDGQDRFDEATAYAPHSPYSASKAASDHLVRAWTHTWGFPAIVTNSSNNYGPRQYPEKLIPVMVRALDTGRPLPVYGDGRNVRDWVHVSDNARGLLVAAARGEPGNTYCVGAEMEISNLELVTRMCRVFDGIRGVEVGTHEARIEFVTDRPGHDLRYAIDSSRLRALGWEPEVDFDSGLRATIEWYLGHPDYWA